MSFDTHLLKGVMSDVLEEDDRKVSIAAEIP